MSMTPRPNHAHPREISLPHAVVRGVPSGRYRCRSQRAARRQRPARMLVSVVVITLVAMVLPPPLPAAAASTVVVSGTVICESMNTVKGVRVDSTDGGSGNASTLWLYPGRHHVAYFAKRVTMIGGSTTVQVSVGCGGTLAHWGSTDRSPTRTVHETTVYNLRCTDSTDKCTSAPLPIKNDDNDFADGQCTYGAAAMWHKATGYFPPGWPGHGNAFQWNNNAAADGFRVSSVPHVRSVVVFEPGVAGYDPTFGHVGWVTKVWTSGTQIKFHMIDMNGSVPGGWGGKDVTFAAGMSFIIAPPGRPVTVHA